MSRRLMLGGGAILLGGADSAPPVQDHRSHLPATAGLHAHSVRKGLFYGAAIDTDWLGGDPATMTQVARECGMLVAENSFKWFDLRPKPDQFNFEHAEMLMAFAAHHGLRVRGHNLAWHLSNPDWLKEVISRNTAEKILTSHIREVVGHFRGRVVQWDVVNEAIQPDDNQPNGMRDSIWYRALGPDYIDIAFHACAAADPAALRVLNEYGVEGVAPWQDKRRAVMLELLAELKLRKVPVQALGIQGHLHTQYRFDQKLFAKFLDDVVAMGYRVMVTEMDINDQALPSDVAARDAGVAGLGRAFLDVILPYPQMLGVVTWGLSDRHSRQDGYEPRADKLPHRPLPLDVDLHRKPLWTEMQNAFDLAPVRGQKSVANGQGSGVDGPSR